MCLIASLNYSQQELEEDRDKGEMLLLHKTWGLFSNAYSCIFCY